MLDTSGVAPLESSMLYMGDRMGSSTLPGYAVRGVAASQWAYWCSLAMAALAIRFIPEGTLRNLVIAMPLLTAALCVSLAYWLYESCDEYLRIAVLRCVVRTAVIVAAFTLAYYIAELAGAPKLSLLWVNLLGWSVFNAQFLFVILRSR
jgi:hypothetical protein